MKAVILVGSLETPIIEECPLLPKPTHRKGRQARPLAH